MRSFLLVLALPLLAVLTGGCDDSLSVPIPIYEAGHPAGPVDASTDGMPGDAFVDGGMADGPIQPDAPIDAAAESAADAPLDSLGRSSDAAEGG